MLHRPLTRSHHNRLRLAACSMVGSMTAATLVAGLGLVAPAGAAPAGAATPTPATTCSPGALAAAKSSALRALTRRVTELNKLSAAIGASTALSTADRSTLDDEVGADQVALSALQQKIPTDTSCTAVADDLHAAVVDYRVFTVVSPQVHLAVAADTESTVAATLGGLDAQIAQRITAAQQEGRTVHAAQATFSDFQAQVATATQASSGVSASVLAVTPASYPGSSPTLQTARTSLIAGRAALVKARADLRTLKADARA